MFHPDEVQEMIDADVAEAERVAEVAIADLRATHEDEIAELRKQLAEKDGIILDLGVKMRALQDRKTGKRTLSVMP